jgi:hypothetical protein
LVGGKVHDTAFVEQPIMKLPMAGGIQKSAAFWQFMSVMIIVPALELCRWVEL